MKFSLILTVSIAASAFGQTGPHPPSIPAAGGLDPPPMTAAGPWDLAINSAHEWISMGSGSEHRFEGDIVLTEQQLRQLNGTENERNGLVDTSSRWTDATVPYTISGKFSKKERDTILGAMNDYHSRTCIKFVERKKEKNYISIVKEGGCWSYVGMIGGRQKVSIGNGCAYHYIVQHELMHAVGFMHEQSRCDRDTYVEILTANIQKGREGNFNKYPCSQVTHFEEPYDYASVMHYGKKDFSKNGKNTIQAKDDPSRTLGNNNGLTQIDENKLNKMYQCAKVTTSATTAGSTTAPSGCTDIYFTSQCPGWANAGYCDASSQYHDFMKNFCRGSCNSEINSCSYCEDLDESTCSSYKDYCGNKDPSLLGIYVAGYCRKTCGDCTCECNCS